MDVTVSSPTGRATRRDTSGAQHERRGPYATPADRHTLDKMHGDPTSRLHAQAQEAYLGLLREEMLEQVMRSTDDEVLAAAFRTVDPGSRDYLIHLGKLLHTNHGGVPSRSPLHQWGREHPERADVNWRIHCPQVAGSLWGELELLRKLVGEITAVDPLAELDALRHAAT